MGAGQWCAGHLAGRPLNNRRFAEIALTIGLAVQKDTLIGHVTPSLSPWARVEYADLLGELERGLVLAREPKLAEPGSSLVDPDNEADEDGEANSSPGVSASSAKYIFASCHCQDGRRRPVTIRVAKGSWRPGVIHCAECRAPFAESMTTCRQDGRQ